MLFHLSPADVDTLTLDDWFRFKAGVDAIRAEQAKRE